MRLLVLDGEQNAARAVLQSLGRAGHDCAIGAPPCRSSSLVSRFAKLKLTYPHPLRDRSAFLRWVLRAQEEFRFDWILPVAETSMVPLHGERQHEALSQHVILPPREALETALDKEEVRVLAQRLGIPVPETLVIPRGETPVQFPSSRDLVYPVVVKPTHSKVWLDSSGTSLQAQIVQERKELGAQLQLLGAFSTVQVQRWVPGIGLGIEILARHGETLLEFAHERIHELPLTGGASTYRKAIVPPPDLANAAKSLMRALKWHGVAMVEFRYDPESRRFWLMEINPRFWGSLPLAIFAGADFPKALLDLYGGGRRSVLQTRRGTCYARNFTGDLHWTKAALRNRPMSHVHSPSPIRITYEWLRLLNGREVWDGASWRDPAPIMHEVFWTLLGFLRGLVIKPLLQSLRSSRERRRSWKRLRQRIKSRRILVVCFGNICRSPYAAARLATLGESLGLQVESTGLHPQAGRSTPPLVHRVARVRGIDLAPHRSRCTTLEAMNRAELILIMERKHEVPLLRIDPKQRDKIVLLGALLPDGETEIADPFGAAAAEVNRILERIDLCCKTFVHALRTKTSAASPTGQPLQRKETLPL